jgi:hypothetical protein
VGAAPIPIDLLPNFPPAALLGSTASPRFIVRDANGQALAHVYFEEEPGRRSAARLLTRDEARRIAANVAKLPGCWTSPDPT